MAEDFPDFTNAVRLLGVDAEGDLVTVLLDSAGNMGAILKATTGAEDLLPVKVDDAGQLYAVLRGADDVDVAVDASGRLEAKIQGAEAGVGWHDVAVDADGRMIMVPRGQSGYYLAVDSQGYLGAILKAAADVNVQGSVPVDQNDKDREVQGADGETLRTLAVDSSGQLIMVPRGQSGNYMTIDANGYMTAVLKGVRDSVLTTIGVDADGRIEAFGLDAEDQWGQTLRTGNSDLAARLGSPLTWDWRGNVLYSHDFSTGWGPLLKVEHGTGASSVVGPEMGGYGGYAAKLTSGSDAWDWASAQFHVGANPCLRVGLAGRFSIDGNTGYVNIFVEHQIGASSPYGSLRLDIANSQLQIYTSGGSWQNVGAVVVNTYSYAYCWLKLVINQSTAYYERALYNETEIDLSSYPCPVTSSTYVGSILSNFVNYGREGQNDVVYLDQLVLTVNEPANT